MSGTFSGDIEGMLRRALAPIEPPEDLAARLESRLTDLHGAAAEQLDSWELNAMRDPRNWGRPVAAAAVATGAGAALVVLRVRAQHRRRAASASDPLDLAEQTLRAVADEARKLIDR